MLEHFIDEFQPAQLARIRLKPAAAAAAAAVKSRPSTNSYAQPAPASVELTIDFWNAMRRALQNTMAHLPQAYSALNQAFRDVYRQFGIPVSDPVS